MQPLEGHYKQGKVYRYSTTELMQNIMVYGVLLENIILKLEGRFMNTCCTCTAGLMGTCNHIAALLFRIGAAISISAIDPTCASVLAKWNEPSNKKH